MRDWKCANCNKKTEHKEKDPKLISFSGYKILTCSLCGTEEMIPEHILDSIDEEKVKEVKLKPIGIDGGFEREVDPDCDSGLCGAR